LTGRLAQRAVGMTAAPPSAQIAPPMLASALLDFGDAQASLVFDACIPAGPYDTAYVAGTHGSLRAWGPDLGHQTVELHTTAGVARPELKGQWFNDGFAGAMGALLVGIETGVPPIHAARANLVSLANAFAAIDSARHGRWSRPGAVRQLPSQEME
jgi:predicted dehydrogenase